MAVDPLEDAAGSISVAQGDGVLSHLCERCIIGTKYIEQLEEKLKQAKALYRELTEVLLPQAMSSAGVQEVEYKGWTFPMAPVVSASIPEHKQPDAMAWLRANEHTDLIKVDINIYFDREEHALAMKVVQLFKNAGRKVTFKEHVHAQTLKKFVKEKVKAGAPLPYDTLGVWVGQRVDLVPPKTTDTSHRKEEHRGKSKG